MNRYERYLADYRAEKANTGELLALTGEELAHSIARLAEADQAELTQAAVYCLEVALDHCRELCRGAMPDQAAASLIGLLFMLLHRKVNPESLPELYCRALTEVVFTSFAAAQKAQSEGDAYAREHWTAIVLQQVALAAATLRFLAPTEGVNPGPMCQNTGDCRKGRIRSHHLALRTNHSPKRHRHSWRLNLAPPGLGTA